MKVKQFTMRCDEDFLKMIEKLSQEESKIVGYKVSQADIVRKYIKIASDNK